LTSGQKNGRHLDALLAGVSHDYDVFAKRIANVSVAYAEFNGGMPERIDPNRASVVSK